MWDQLKENYDKYDFFFIHFKKTDSYGEDGNFDAKVKVIETVDKWSVKLRELNPDVIVVTGDHSTPALLKSHSWHPVPVLLWGKNVRTDEVKQFGEKHCINGYIGRMPMKNIILIAMAVTVVANLGLALSNSWVALSIWRIFSGLPFAFMSVYVVLVSFMFSEKRRGSAVALAAGSAMLGMGGSQALSGYLVKVLGGNIGLYYLAAGLAVLAILFLLPAKIPVVKSPTGISGKDIRQVIGHKAILYTGITLMI